MMIALSKPIMANNKYVAGLLLILLLSSTDVFASNEIKKISTQHTYKNLDKPILSSPLISPFNSERKIEKGDEFQKLPIELNSFQSLTPFFEQSQKPYISDGVKFLSSKQSFIDLGVDLNQTALFIKKVGEFYDSIFKNEINNLSSSNKMMMIKIKISSNHKNNNCVDKCSQTKITFHSSDSFGSEITDFSKKVREIPAIEIKNNLSLVVAEFQIYLNTKPKNFATHEHIIKSPAITVSPFSDRG